MEYYDIIIIGAGIAGCGLVYNLQQSMFKGSVLLIDKRDIGSNESYGYRIVLEDTIKKYKINYTHIYKGLKIGSNNQVYFTVANKFYLINYKKTCSKLLSASKMSFKKEQAIYVNGNYLKTEKENYKFKYLIDCTGTSFFLKKQLSQRLPFRYWIGHTKILENTPKIKDDCMYYMFDDNGFMEDFYPLKNKILQGDWQYTKKIDFNMISPSPNTLLKNISSPKVIKEFYSVDPVSPLLPNTYKNYAFLGDSFSNSTPSSGVGIEPTLESSRMLAYAICKNNLKLYSNLWNKKYFNTYILSLTSRLDRYHNTSFIEGIKKYPKNTKALKILGKNPTAFIDHLMNRPNFQITKEIGNIYPNRQKLFLLFYYLYLRFIYFLK